jgi:hypothetical protein
LQNFQGVAGFLENILNYASYRYTNSVRHTTEGKLCRFLSQK